MPPLREHARLFRYVRSVVYAAGDSAAAARCPPPGATTAQAQAHLDSMELQAEAALVASLQRTDFVNPAPGPSTAQLTMACFRLHASLGLPSYIPVFAQPPLQPLQPLQTPLGPIPIPSPISTPIPVPSPAPSPAPTLPPYSGPLLDSQSLLAVLGAHIRLPAGVPRTASHVAGLLPPSLSPEVLAEAGGADEAALSATLAGVFSRMGRPVDFPQVGDESASVRASERASKRALLL